MRRFNGSSREVVDFENIKPRGSFPNTACVAGGIVMRGVFSLSAGYFLGGGAATDFR